MQKKSNLGIYTIIGIPLIAVVLWVLAPSVDLKVSNAFQIASLLGRVFGIIGMMLFAESMILSARLPILDKMFYGLNRVYEKHSQIGQIGFMFMLFHPLFLAFTYTDLSFSRIISFFTPSQYTPAINFGQISLYLLIVLIALTLYLRPKYNIWKYTHKFMGLAFFFGGLHAFMIPSDTSSFLPLRLYVLAISAIAMYAFIYRTIFGKYTTKKYKYSVVKATDLGEGITEVVLRNEGERVNFTPGQFGFVSFRDKNIGYESHPFSFSSALGDNNISFTIKNLGDWTSQIKNLPVGTVALVEGPFGKFQVSEAQFKKQIWVAGGIGITPFLSMAKSLKVEDGYAVDLYYCVRNKQEAVYLSQLQAMNNPSLHIFPHYSETDGFINADVINKKSGLLQDRSIFICSPVPMIRALRKQFVAIGVSSNLIHSEEFSLS